VPAHRIADRQIEDKRSMEIIASITVPLKKTIRTGSMIIFTGLMVRIRKDKRGPERKKGRRRYSTHWREPKQSVPNATTLLVTKPACLIKRSQTITFPSEAVPWKARSEEY
jgi:hypothetical protein